MAGELELAGKSERDRAIREFVRTRLVRSPEAGPLASVLLLGPRGSGKTTLLGHLAEWGRLAPLAHVDLAARGRHGAKPLDVLTRLVFQLNENKRDFPRLTFPTCGLLLIAVSTRVDLSSRERAVQQLREALEAPRGQRGDRLQGVLEAFAEAAATVMGAPNFAVAPALRLLPTSMGARGVSLATRQRLARIRRQQGGRPVNDFIVNLNMLYNDRESAERERAEQVLFDAFVADLQQAYGTRSAQRKRTTNCLLLLDNADSPLGGQFLEPLLRAREKAECRDPLLVLATAASRPEALVRREQSGPPHSGAYLACWEKDREFQPVRVDSVLHVGQLRDLYQREVNKEAEEMLRRVPVDAPMPETDDGVQWLGWLVRELTRGQPAATAALLDALRAQTGDDPWDERLRRLFTPQLVRDMLDRLLPMGTSVELRAMLARAAAAVHLGQAGAARELWRDASEALGADFALFSGDPLRTMHLATGDELTDGPHETLHPVLRFLLLRELAQADTTADTWDVAHTALSLRAAARIEEGHEAESWAVAYHDLASGHLEAAATHLDGCFTRMPAEEWCRGLCRLRRAPVRTPGGGLAGPPRQQFEALVRFLNDPERPRDRRMKAVTRLLAASWIAPEPRDDQATDRVGDPYRNPLGDPYAELYPDIREEFLTLRAMVDDEADRHVFLRKSEQYKRRPWW
ncbi:ATP-binding protein [Streptomyces armeniacus]|uniref:ATP-binding protein n=1 Tax=Streptomyces armeniacus TaxID=83291 RepID=UPI001AD81E6E|nr:ATP-binding protein [Streptomyces armeniacus]